MKSLKIISCVLCFTTLFFCTTNEDQIDSVTNTAIFTKESHDIHDINNPLVLKWGLFHLQGGFAGFNEFYSYGQITWKFNFTDQTFTILNLANFYPSGGYLATGVYSCNITTNPDGTFCFSNGTLSGCSSSNSNILNLSEVKVSDAIHLQFVH